MAKQVIVTLDKYDPSDAYTMEHPKGESVTVPGEAMTVREIFDRYVRGQEIDPDQQRAGMYYDEDQNFDSPDLEQIARNWSVENQEYLQELKLDIEIKREKLNSFLKAMENKDASQGDASASPKGSEGADSGDDQSPKKAPSSARTSGKAKGGAKRSESDDLSD